MKRIWIIKDPSSHAPSPLDFEPDPLNRQNYTEFVEVAQAEPTPPFDPSKPVKQRNGRGARIVAKDCKGSHPIVALIIDGDGVEYPQRYKINGKFTKGPIDSALDLVNVPEEPVVSEWKVWLYLNRNSEGHHFVSTSPGTTIIARHEFTLEFQIGDGL